LKTVGPRRCPDSEEAAGGRPLPGLLQGNASGNDQITIKTPNPKCRLYWCLIEFIDCHFGIFPV